MSDVAQRVREFLAQQVFRETPWEFSTSSGIELAIGTPLAHVGFNATGGCLWVKDGPNGAPQKLRYGGVGGSGGLALVPTKINLSFSMPQMQSFGKVYALPFANDQLSFDDLKRPFMVVTYATDFGAGWGVSFMFLHCSRNIVMSAAIPPSPLSGLQIPGFVSTAHALVVLSGMSATLIPGNFGGTVYFGDVF